MLALAPISRGTSRRRAARQASLARVWHCGQWRLRHERQTWRSAPQFAQRSRTPPSAAVRQSTIARQARAWVGDSVWPRR